MQCLVKKSKYNLLNACLLTIVTISVKQRWQKKGFNNSDKPLMCEPERWHSLYQFVDTLCCYPKMWAVHHTHCGVVLIFGDGRGPVLFVMVCCFKGSKHKISLYMYCAVYGKKN